MTLSYWQDVARPSSLHVDVAVVGGGLIGCATAYWLHVMAPGLKVAVLESGRLASGMSGRSAGLLLPGVLYDYLASDQTFDGRRARQRWQFMEENLKLLTTELDPGECGLEQRGVITVLGRGREEALLQRTVSRMRSDGVPVAPLTPEQTNERLGAEELGAGLYVPSGAVVDPVRLIRQLARQSAADVLEHHPVQHVYPTDDGAVLETPERRVVARKLVLAVGGDLTNLYPALKRYVRPIRGQMLATEPASSRWMPTPAYLHDPAYFLRQLADGTLMVGESYSRNRHVESEVDATTPAVQARLERHLHRHYPRARGLAIRRRWSGIMGCSPDRLPVVGRVPDVDGSYWAGGFTGEGLGYGMRLGQLLAELLTGTTHPEGFDTFSEDRFDPVPAH